MSPQGICFAHGEELGEERRRTFVPRLDSFLFLVKPLLRLPQEGEGKQAEPNALRCDVLDEAGTELEVPIARVTQLEEVLEMRIRILARQTMEWVCLHHCDEASTEVEVPIASVDSRPNGHVSSSRDGVAAENLGHA